MPPSLVSLVALQPSLTTFLTFPPRKNAGDGSFLCYYESRPRGTGVGRATFLGPVLYLIGPLLQVASVGLSDSQDRIYVYTNILSLVSLLRGDKVLFLIKKDRSRVSQIVESG